MEQVVFACFCNNLEGHRGGTGRGGGRVWRYVFMWLCWRGRGRGSWRSLSHSLCSPLFASLIRPAVPPYIRSQFVLESCCVCSWQGPRFPRLHVWSTPCVRVCVWGWGTHIYCTHVQTHTHTKNPRHYLNKSCLLFLYFSNSPFHSHVWCWTSLEVLFSLRPHELKSSIQSLVCTTSPPTSTLISMLHAESTVACVEFIVNV